MRHNNNNQGEHLVMTHVSGRQLVATYPLTAALWTISLVLLVASFATDNDHLGRAGLFVSAAAAVVSARDLARHVITRLTHVIHLFEEDIELEDDKPPKWLDPYDIARQRRRREAGQRSFRRNLGS